MNVTLEDVFVLNEFPGGVVTRKSMMTSNGTVLGYVDSCQIDNCAYVLRLELSSEFRGTGESVDIVRQIEPQLVGECDTILWFEISEPVGKIWDALSNTTRPYTVASSGARVSVLAPSS